MEIILAEHRGFCYGVKRAVKLAMDSKADFPIYTLGPLIHNPQLVSKLSEEGLKVTHELDEIAAGTTIVIRSHGVGPEIYKKAADKNLTVVDATCPHVKKAQTAARDLMLSGYQVIIIGESDHPEVKSILAWADQKALIIDSKDAAGTMPFCNKIGIVAQTTFPSCLFDELVDLLKGKCNEMQIRRTICTATDERQEAALKLAGQVDIMIVVGGKNSANTARLAQICKQVCGRVYHIETANELKKECFLDAKRIGITAGASTPEFLIEEVYDTCQNLTATM